jgi:hypothetical protein
LLSSSSSSSYNNNNNNNNYYYYYYYYFYYYYHHHHHHHHHQHHQKHHYLNTNPPNTTIRSLCHPFLRRHGRCLKSRIHRIATYDDHSGRHARSTHVVCGPYRRRKQGLCTAAPCLRETPRWRWENRRCARGAGPRRGGAWQRYWRETRPTNWRGSGQYLISYQFAAPSEVGV